MDTNARVSPKIEDISKEDNAKPGYLAAIAIGRALKHYSLLFVQIWKFVLPTSMFKSLLTDMGSITFNIYSCVACLFTFLFEFNI